MQFDRKLAVSFLDFEFGRGGLYAESVIICCFHDHVRGYHKCWWGGSKKCRVLKWCWARV
jgi:hypothetical protein